MNPLTMSSSQVGLCNPALLSTIEGSSIGIDMKFISAASYDGSIELTYPSPFRPYSVGAATTWRNFGVGLGYHRSYSLHWNEIREGYLDASGAWGIVKERSGQLDINTLSLAISWHVKSILFADDRFGVGYQMSSHSIAFEERDKDRDIIRRDDYEGEATNNRFGIFYSFGPRVDIGMLYETTAHAIGSPDSMKFSLPSFLSIATKITIGSRLNLIVNVNQSDWEAISDEFGNTVNYSIGLQRVISPEIEGALSVTVDDRHVDNLDLILDQKAIFLSFGLKRQHGNLTQWIDFHESGMFSEQYRSRTIINLRLDYSFQSNVARN